MARHPLHFMAVLMDWKSEAQTLYSSLSSSENKCIVVSELLKEVPFAKKIAVDLDCKIEMDDSNVPGEENLLITLPSLSSFAGIVLL